MMELSDKQVQLLECENGEAVEVINPATRAEYVLLRRAAYEHLRFQSIDNFTSDDAFWASGAIHDSMGVPPTEELMSPTGTLSVR